MELEGRHAEVTTARVFRRVARAALVGQNHLRFDLAVKEVLVEHDFGKLELRARIHGAASEGCEPEHCRQHGEKRARHESDRNITSLTRASFLQRCRPSVGSERARGRAVAVPALSFSERLDIEVKDRESAAKQPEALHKLLCRPAKYRLAPIYAAQRNRRLKAETEATNSWPSDLEGGILSYICIP